MLAIGIGIIVKVMLDVSALLHGIVAYAINDKTTEPAAVSALPGVYTVFELVGLLNTPSPDVIHKT